MKKELWALAQRTQDYKQATKSGRLDPDIYRRRKHARQKKRRAGQNMKVTETDEHGWKDVLQRMRRWWLN